MAELGQAALANEHALQSMQVETQQTQGDTSFRSRRILWTPMFLGLAASGLLGVSAWALLPASSHAAATSNFVSSVAFSNVGRIARVQARPTGQIVKGPVKGFASIQVKQRQPKSQVEMSGATKASLTNEIPSWERLQELLPSSVAAKPRTIDAALTYPAEPDLPGLTLFRERHGWCPYSERVWLAMEVKGLHYDTVLIDNTGPGRKPPWWGGSTPQIQWDDGKSQGESLDIIKELDRRYPETVQLWENDDITKLVDAFRQIFPKSTRPSSRAAFLFKGGGEVPRSEFEQTLDKTNDLLGKNGGPFFYGKKVTAADIAWAPFLERYAEQLPCLHAGLDPRDASRWPHLAAWYDGMMQLVPAYAARVRGDNVSWRKVLNMAGYGNQGAAPVLQPEDSSKKLLTDTSEGDWNAYAAERDYIASSPGEEAAALVVRNRVALARDIVKKSKLKEEDADEALRGLAALLSGTGSETDAAPEVVAAAKYLDEAMCVPRDMGVLPSRAVRGLADRLRNLGS